MPVFFLSFIFRQMPTYHICCSAFGFFYLAIYLRDFKKRVIRKFSDF